LSTNAAAKEKAAREKANLYKEMNKYYQKPLSSINLGKEKAAREAANFEKVNFGPGPTTNKKVAESMKKLAKIKAEREAAVKKAKINAAEAEEEIAKKVAESMEKLAKIKAEREAAAERELVLAKQEAEKAKKEAEDAKKKANKKNATLQEQAESVRTLKKVVSSLQEELKSLQKLNEFTQSNLKQVRKEKEQSNANKSKLQIERNNLASNLKKGKNLEDELRGELSTAKEELKESAKELEKMHVNRQTNKESMEKLTININLLTKGKNLNMETLQKLREELNNARRSSKQIPELQKQIQELQKQLVEYAATRTKLSTTYNLNSPPPIAEFLSSSNSEIQLLAIKALIKEKDKTKYSISRINTGRHISQVVPGVAGAIARAQNGQKKNASSINNLAHRILESLYRGGKEVTPTTIAQQVKKAGTNNATGGRNQGQTTSASGNVNSNNGNRGQTTSASRQQGQQKSTGPKKESNGQTTSASRQQGQRKSTGPNNRNQGQRKSTGPNNRNQGQTTSAKNNSMKPEEEEVINEEIIISKELREVKKKLQNHVNQVVGQIQADLLNAIRKQNQEKTEEIRARISSLSQSQSQVKVNGVKFWYYNDNGEPRVITEKNARKHILSLREEKKGEY
jgi:chromosome segregation ATPase